MSSPGQWGDLTVEGGARRQAIRRHHRNGLDTIEVDERGRRLVLTFLERAPDHVHPSNIRIDGPRQSPVATVTGVKRAAEEDPQLESRLLVQLSGPGGPGTYTLRLVEHTADGRPGWAPLRALDPRFAQGTFSFDIDLPNPVSGAGPAATASQPERQASYLARDYEGLRQLILDRMAQTMPAWTERHAADIGVTLVELLAYIGDDLSYYQDAVATEAYLRTARQRISVRRHARLTGYRLGEGCQARAWVFLTVTGAAELPLRGLEFAAAAGLAEGAPALLQDDGLGNPTLGPVRMFTPVRAHVGSPSATSGASQGTGPTVSVNPAHNQIALWSWGERDSWLCAGATHAVLADRWTEPADHSASAPRALTLQAGDVLALEATAGPAGTGPPDPEQRLAVRLTAVHAAVDRLYDQPILEVTWAEAEALPFDLQVTAPGPAGTSVACAVARGNAVLVGDGRAVSDRLDPDRTEINEPELTWASPYPAPGAVARYQAKVLRELPHAWRELVETWRREAEHGAALSEGRLARLRQLLGHDALTAFGLGRRAGRRGEPDHADPAQDAEGLRHLLQDAASLLAPRVRRLTSLADLARSGGPLEPALLREVAGDWGEDLAGPLSPHHPAAWGTAREAVSQDPRLAVPLLSVAPVSEPGGGGPAPWTVVCDLVGSLPGSRQVMVEVDDAGLGHLRFSPGDEPAGPVTVSYHIGQGTAGNVPAEAINAIVPLTPGAAAEAAVVQGVRNPLPAAGGTDPETIQAAKAAVPGAFLLQQPRALVAADYTTIARQVPGVRRAATVLRWTGMRYAADVTVQPSAGEDPGEELLGAVRDALWPVRRIGHDLWVAPPRYRPLVVGLNVDIGVTVVRADAAAALNALLSSGLRPDGTPGLFSPVRLGFGEPVYASPIVAAVQDVAGVVAVVLTRFGFLGPPGKQAAGGIPGRLLLQPGEIARLDNDPGAPEHGYAVLNLRGGR